MSVVRYAIGKLSLPYFTKWVLDRFDIDLEDRRGTKPLPERNDFPSPIVDAGIVDELSDVVIVPLW